MLRKYYMSYDSSEVYFVLQNKHHLEKDCVLAS